MADQPVAADDILSKILPGAPRPAKTTIDGGVVWIYGDMKIGKSTFASRFPGAWFLATEKGQEFIECREPTQINSWNGFMKFVDILDQTRPKTFQDGEPIKWIVVDVYDDLYRMCFNAVCGSLGVEDPGEMTHGKGWTRLRQTFWRVMDKLRALPYGLLLISHFKVSKFESAGRKCDRYEPNVGAAGYDWAKKQADLIGFASIKEVPEKLNGQVTGKIVYQRVLHVHPSPTMVAGGRIHSIFPPCVALSSDVIHKYFSAQTPTKEEIDAASAEDVSETLGEQDEEKDNTTSPNKSDVESDESSSPAEGEDLDLDEKTN